ncbi:hypothetical protein ACS0TY_017356 [Phlomoides rotata]
MEQSDFDSITTKDRHPQENISELQRNYDQPTLNVKVSGTTQQANLDTVQTSNNGIRYAQHLLWQALERPLLKIGSPLVTQKERVPEPGKVDSAYTSPSSKEKVHQVEPPQGFQVLGPGKANCDDTSSSSKLEETEHQASKPDVSGQPITSGSRVEFWHNNPHLKRGEELEIKFIIIASEDTTNAIHYLSFHFIKLQWPDKKTFTYIKE